MSGSGSMSKSDFLVHYVLQVSWPICRRTNSISEHWTVSISAPVWCASSTGVFMARLHGRLLGGLLYTGHWPRHSIPSLLCQAPSACHSTLSALHLQLSGVLGRCPRDLEFTAGWSAGASTDVRLLQATAEDDTFFWSLVHSVQRISLGVLLSMRSTNLIWHLTFMLLSWQRADNRIHLTQPSWLHWQIHDKFQRDELNSSWQLINKNSMELACGLWWCSVGYENCRKLLHQAVDDTFDE